MLRCLVIALVGTLAAALALPAEELRLTDYSVRVLREDVDADGAAEVILRNNLVRVEVFTGQAPELPARPLWRRVLNRPLPPPAPKYNCRFMGPGWIGNIVFLPTGRRWLADAVMPTEAWRGVPEEFEQAVRIRETSPGVWRCLKIGVGVCEGRGWCTRDTLTLLDPGHWETRVEEAAAGGRSVVFEQTLDAGDGYAYRYGKRLTLWPGDTRLTLERTLANTGTRELATTWYTHAFWGQGQEGRSDEHCWATIPLRRGPAAEKGLPELDTEACPIGAPVNAGYWGPLDGSLVGDAWYACGNHRGAEVLLHVLADLPAFYRVWSCPPTYSLEPFRLLTVAPGQTESWSETMACGTGLDRVDTHDGLAAYAASVTPASEDAPARIEVRGVPFGEVHNTLLRMEIEPSTGDTQQVEKSIAWAGPDRPFAVSLDEWVDRLPLRLRLRLEPGGAVTGNVGQSRTGWLTVRAPAPESPELPAHAGGVGAVILLPADRGASGALPASRAAAFLVEYLKAAGFAPEVRSDRDGTSGSSDGLPALVVCPGLRGMPVPLWRELEQAVRGGAGLLVCAPIEPFAFEFTDLVPLRAAGATLRLGSGPRDGTREFVGAYRQRYQFCTSGAHPVTAGLPWFPTAPQDVGVLQDVTPAAGAEVLLRYATPAGLQPRVDSPALVVAAYGQGRVAVFGSPVDWGAPPQWGLWRRIGEAHRQYFMRLALWTAAGALPMPVSAPPSSDCGSRPRSE